MHDDRPGALCVRIRGAESQHLLVAVNEHPLSVHLSRPQRMRIERQAIVRRGYEIGAELLGKVDQTGRIEVEAWIGAVPGRVAPTQLGWARQKRGSRPLGWLRAGRGYVPLPSRSRTQQIPRPEIAMAQTAGFGW
jgi:hypothetical protein